MKRKARQLRLDVTLFVVRSDGFVDRRIQARSAAAAKFEVFRQLREAGYFSDRAGGFRDFLSRGWSVYEVRR